MNERIILLETSGSVTSVALAEEGKIVAVRQTEKPRMQASLTAVFIDEVLKERGIGVKDCDAVCLSMGPGSYTGLRVGSSTAKGLCFGAGIPLIAVGTLDVIVAKAIEEGLVPEGCKYIIPMIDARRMEVYTALYSPEGKRLDEVKALIIDGDSFKQERSEGPVLLVGDGALKCQKVLDGPQTFFAHLYPDAKSMLGPAMAELKARNWRDTAYFEPFYLKDFVATVSAKKLF